MCTLPYRPVSFSPHMDEPSSDGLSEAGDQSTKDPDEMSADQGLNFPDTDGVSEGDGGVAEALAPNRDRATEGKSLNFGGTDFPDSGDHMN